MNFENFVYMMRPSGIQIVFGPLSLLPNSFPMMIFLQLVVQEKEYMKLDVGRWLAIILRGVVSPLTR